MHRRLVSAVKRIEFVSDRLSYIVLIGRWLHIILVNVHAPSKEKSEELKDNFYEELEEVFDHFPKYRMKMLLGDFNAKVGREDIFNPIIITILMETLLSNYWLENILSTYFCIKIS